MRGVVVVPSRELARQVHAVFEALKPEMEDIPMRICLAAGQPDEQVLIEPNWDLIPPSRRPRPAEGKWGFWQLHKFPFPDLVPEEDREPVPQGGIVDGQCDTLIGLRGDGRDGVIVGVAVRHQDAGGSEPQELVQALEGFKKRLPLPPPL